MDGWIDGSMDGLQFYDSLRVLQSYQDDVRVIVNDCVHSLNLVYG